MAKVQIKSEKITSFEVFFRLLSYLMLQSYDFILTYQKLPLLFWCTLNI